MFIEKLFRWLGWRKDPPLNPYQILIGHYQQLEVPDLSDARVRLRMIPTLYQHLDVYNTVMHRVTMRLAEKHFIGKLHNHEVTIKAFGDFCIGGDGYYLNLPNAFQEFKDLAVALISEYEKLENNPQRDAIEETNFYTLSPLITNLREISTCLRWESPHESKEKGLAIRN